MLRTGAPSGGRFKNIDALRGIAALLVLWLHAAEVLVTLPPVAAFGTLTHDFAEFFQIGRAGVIAFFAISGFVVASTIKPPRREGTFDFAIKRFFRLYPAYWLALTATYALIWWPQGRLPATGEWLANVTMLPTVFGVTSAMGHFWTLEIEFVFYVLVVVLFLTGRLQHPWFIVGIIVVLALKPASLVLNKLTWAPGQGHWGELPLCLAIMLCGSLLRARYDAEARAIGKLRAWATAPIAVATLLVVGRALNPGAALKGVDFMTWLGGLGTLWGLLLFVAFALSGQRWPRFMVWWGTVSYSIYLFHPAVFYPLYFFLKAHPQYAGAPLIVWVMLCAVATIALASLTYRLVEAPANAFALRLTRKPRSAPGLSDILSGGRSP